MQFGKFTRRISRATKHKGIRKKFKRQGSSKNASSYCYSLKERATRRTMQFISKRLEKSEQPEQTRFNYRSPPCMAMTFLHSTPTSTPDTIYIIGHHIYTRHQIQQANNVLPHTYHLCLRPHWLGWRSPRMSQPKVLQRRNPTRSLRHHERTSTALPQSANNVQGVR
jgi:hypothetical protein